MREGIIIEGAKWKEIFPLIKDDERFLNMLGQAGSTPLELFWDVVDSIEIEFRLKRDYVLDVLEVYLRFHLSNNRKNGLKSLKQRNMMNSNHLWQLISVRLPSLDPCSNVYLQISSKSRNVIPPLAPPAEKQTHSGVFFDTRPR